MDGDHLDSLSDHYDRIGQAIRRSGPGSNDKFWLFAVAGDEWVEDALFQVESGALRWVDADPSLTYEILDLWEREDRAKRWEAMVFEVSGNRFNTDFYYDGDFPANTTNLERRIELMRRRFGNYQVVYPPFPGAPTA
jgi:hypothetical protein